ncbi:hypothetical protein P7C71_g2639, partial [Lecanoromycetidae sp. Uapishka_2]
MSGTETKAIPQDEKFSSAKVVVKGDTLETQADFLESAPMMVEWSQKWITRKEKYFFVVFENISQGNDKGRLFINEKALAEFKHNPTRDGKIAFKVDEEYQFGQANKEGKERFLVFHDKNNTIYQHRFVNSLWINLGHKLGEIAGDLGPGVAKNAAPTVEKELLKIFGDPLKNF